MKRLLLIIVWVMDMAFIQLIIYKVDCSLVDVVITASALLMVDLCLVVIALGYLWQIGRQQRQDDKDKPTTMMHVQCVCLC